MTNLIQALRQAARSALPAVLLGLMLADAALAAEPEETDTFNIETMVCWDLAGLEEEERGFVLVMACGYVAGVQDMPVHPGSRIGAAFEYMGRLCDANPDMYIVSAVERAMDKHIQ